MLLSKEFDKTLVLPYTWQKEVEDFFYPLDWKTLNRGKNKKIIRDAFEPEFKQIEPIQKHTLECGEIPHENANIL